MFQEISLASKSTTALTTTAHVRRSAFVEPTKHKSERNAKGQTSFMIWGTRRVGRRRDKDGKLERYSKKSNEAIKS